MKSVADTLARITPLGLKVEQNNPQQAFITGPDDVRVELLQDDALPVPIRMHHVHIWVPAPLEAQAWYVKYFGATVGKPRATSTPPTCPALNCGDRATRPELVPTEGRSLDHIGFEVRQPGGVPEALAVARDRPNRRSPPPWRQQGDEISYIEDTVGHANRDHRRPRSEALDTRRSTAAARDAVESVAPVTTSAGSIAARLNRLAPTRAHREATVVAGIGTFFDIFDIFLTGVLSTVLVEEFHLGRSALPPILASSFVGMFVGAWTLGWIADRVGRRTAFFVNLAIYSGFTLAGAFSGSATMLIFTRFMAGIGIGAELVLVDTYLGELLPPSHRGRYTAWAYTLGFVGVPAAGFLARVLVPTAPFGVAGWRWMFVAGSLGAVIVWGLRARLPRVAALACLGWTPRRSRRHRDAVRAGGALAPTRPASARGTGSLRGGRAAPGPRPRVPGPHGDAVRPADLPGVRLLRVRHAGPDRPRGEGILDRHIVGLYLADLHRLSGRGRPSRCCSSSAWTVAGCWPAPPRS